MYSILPQRTKTRLFAQRLFLPAETVRDHAGTQNSWVISVKVAQNKSVVIEKKYFMVVSIIFAPDEHTGML